MSLIQKYVSYCFCFAFFDVNLVMWRLDSNMFLKKFFFDIFMP